MGEAMSLLLIEDNPGDVRLIEELLNDAANGAFTLSHADSLDAGLRRLSHDMTYDAVLTDLNLPDSDRLDTFLTLQCRAPHVPIVIMTTMSDDAAALEAVRRGAQDYLVKGEATGRDLVSALRYAVERHRAQDQLHRLAAIDELTKLFNRRGFLAAAMQHAKLCDRTSSGFLLVFLDVNNLKAINDTHGHPTGDRALVHVADALRSTFRGSDIVGRWAGDEFVAIATNAAADDGPHIHRRLHSALANAMCPASETTPISICLGWAYGHPDRTLDIDALIAEADVAMYRSKNSTKMPD